MFSDKNPQVFLILIFASTPFRAWFLLGADCTVRCCWILCLTSWSSRTEMKVLLPKLYFVGKMELASAYSLFKNLVIIRYNFLNEKKSTFPKLIQQSAFFFGTILVITILSHLISVTENCSKNQKEQKWEYMNLFPRQRLKVHRLHHFGRLKKIKMVNSFPYHYP